MNNRWGPPKKPRFFRTKEFIRFQMKRWYPEKVHTPFSKRYRKSSKFTPHKIPRYVREKTNCGEVIVHSRFWLTLQTHNNVIKHHHWWRWHQRQGLIRKVRPGLISYSIAGIQPMTAPTGKIFTVKPVYSNGDVGERLKPTVSKTVSH